MIAQRLQIETVSVLTKVVERHNNGYVSVIRGLTAGGQREINTCGTIGFHRRLYVELRERYVLAGVTVQGIQGVGDQCVVVDLNRRAAVFENQSGGGLRFDGRIDPFGLVGRPKGWRSVVSHLRRRRLRCVIGRRLVSIIGLLWAGLGACVVLAGVGKPAIGYRRAIAER